MPKKPVGAPKPLLTEAMIGSVADIFSALSDPSRLRLLKALSESADPLSQGALAEAAGVSQANASKHLALLARVGLVTRAPEGNTVYYSPVMPLVGNLCDLVCGHVSLRAKETFQALR